jgi:hypothetical protein
MLQLKSGRTRTALAGTAILLTMAVLTFCSLASGAPNIFALPYQAEDAGSLIAHARTLVWESYRAAPALTLGLMFASTLPILALLLPLSKPLMRHPNATRRYRAGRNDPFEATADGPRGTRAHYPFVEIENGRGLRCTILRDMLRIGREDDNDIRIPSKYVHRYHAAIHREDFDDWRITDLTGVESNGLIVNGKRCCEARLRDGDLIQLGPGKLRFRAGAG